MKQTRGFASKKELLDALTKAGVQNPAAIIDALPDADVQEIVHCEDCKYSEPNCEAIKGPKNIREFTLLCKLSKQRMKPQNSCERGIRREREPDLGELTVERVKQELTRLGWNVQDVDDITGFTAATKRYIFEREFGSLSFAHAHDFSSEKYRQCAYGYGGIVCAANGEEMAIHIYQYAAAFKREQWIAQQVTRLDGKNLDYDIDDLESCADTVLSEVLKLKTVMHALLQRYCDKTL